MNRLVTLLSVAALGSTFLMRPLSAQPQPPQLQPPPVPGANPITVAKTNLGKTLFWEEQMSSSGTMACATCHSMAGGGADIRTAVSLNPGLDGVFNTPDDVHGSPGLIARNANGTHERKAPFPLQNQVTRRKTPPVLMSAYPGVQFWDGRATGNFTDPVTNQVVIHNGASLETQAKAPAVNTEEMAHAGEDWTGIAQRVGTVRPLALASNLPSSLETWIGGRSYPQLFLEAFGTPDVTPSRILLAIATYERTLIPNQTPYDAFAAGNPGAMTQQEHRGFQLFTGPARCAVCHAPPTFAGPGFANIGVRPIAEDRGRAEVTNAPQDQGAFKIQQLRNVAQRAPFFHNGGKATLEEVVEFYSRAGDFHVNQDQRIQPFQLLPGDRDAIVAFLRNALTDPRVTLGTGPFEHPTLANEAGRYAKAYGVGTPGTDGFVPRFATDDPSYVGNNSYTISLDRALGSKPAILVFDTAPGTGSLVWGNVQIWIAGTTALTGIDAGLLRAGGAGVGWGSWSFKIPNNPALGGGAAYLQGFVMDPGAVYGVAATGGLRVGFFGQR